MVWEQTHCTAVVPQGPENTVQYMVLVLLAALLENLLHGSMDGKVPRDSWSMGQVRGGYKRFLGGE